ncbi:MAG: YncE family protein [Actinobacteria bacterium]|nr:YncE family protein [Actinomycetota bacterium]
MPAAKRRLELTDTITGDISPKSVVASGDGLVLAQNMMYRHTVTAYDRAGRLRATIPDEVDLSAFGVDGYGGTHRGAPVEAAFAPSGDHAYVSNYSMYGPGFGREGSAVCAPGDGTDHSYVYRIDTATVEIDDVVEVGAVPKYVAVSPDGRWVLVTNWCSYDLSVIDTEQGREVRRVDIGAYPRGIAVDPASSTAYVAVMGSTHIAAVDLDDFSVSTIDGVGQGPRDLRMSPDGRFLYATLNAEGTVVKIHRRTGEVRARVSTGQAPRSLAISGDGTALYAVNYHSNTVSKIRTRDMAVVQTVDTHDKPIGITYDAAARKLWVACYSGSIMIFKDTR